MITQFDLSVSFIWIYFGLSGLRPNVAQRTEQESFWYVVPSSPLANWEERKLVVSQLISLPVSWNLTVRSV